MVLRQEMFRVKVTLHLRRCSTSSTTQSLHISLYILNSLYFGLPGPQSGRKLRPNESVVRISNLLKQKIRSVQNLILGPIKLKEFFFTNDNNSSWLRKRENSKNQGLLLILSLTPPGLGLSSSVKEVRNLDLVLRYTDQTRFQ